MRVASAHQQKAVRVFVDPSTPRLAGGMAQELAAAVEDGATVEGLRERIEQLRLKKKAGLRPWRKATVLALSISGMTQTEIADVMGLTVETTRAMLYAMRRQGVGIDSEERLDYGVVPEAIAALHADVRDRTSEHHHEAYMGVLRGRRLLKTHAAGNGDARAVQTMLAVKFEMPPGMVVPQVVGTVVGKAREDT